MLTEVVMIWYKK